MTGFVDRSSSNNGAFAAASASAPAEESHSAWDAIRDQLEVMLHQEETAYRVRGAQRPDGGFGPPPPFTFSDGGDLDVCRRKMCEWAFNVVDYFDYSRDLVSASLCHVDRYVSFLLSSGRTVCKRRFQSVSVTALYMTLKMQGASAGRVDSRSGRKRHLSISTFVELSRGILSAEALEEEERRMLEGLDYRINPPTPVAFVEYLVPLLLSRKASPSAAAAAGGPGVDDRTLHYVYELSRYFTELAVFERGLSVGHKPSCVAFASVLNAVSAVGSAAFPPAAGAAAGRGGTSFAADALERAPLRLRRAEVEDAWAFLARLCPLETLEWPGCEGGGGSGRGNKRRSADGSRATPVQDTLSQESPTSVTNFMP